MLDLHTLIAAAVAILALLAGVSTFGTVGVFVIVVVALLALTTLAGAAGRRARRMRERPDPRFVPTEEIFRDPAGGQLVRVHVDPATGERRYLKA
jgi:hypothetical protein